MATVDTEAVREKFSDFFNTQYKRELAELKASYPEKKSFYFSYKDLEKVYSEVADELLEQPDIILGAARDALYEMGTVEKKFEPSVRVTDLPTSGLLVQELGAAQIQKMISIEGVVTKRSEVRPRVKMAVYKCARCDTVYKIPIEKGSFVPETCEQCHKRALVLDEEMSYFVNLQRSEMQELLERVRGGTNAATVKLILEGDLVNTIIPGDTVDVIGIVRIQPMPKGKSHEYTKYIEVLSIKNVQREFEEVELNKEDIKEINDFAKKSDIFDALIKSIAPSIYGHEEVKEALVLQLFGGTPNKTLPEGGRIRGDIHILLIGDPGVSKTRMLQYIAELAPKSIYVSGKSVTGAGLTASAEKDEGGEGWVLKAGALVLASGGLGCIDEFNQIEKEEVGALHEVMESQTISVAKAGIVARFKAKTAILAAANPKFGRFDPNQLPADQFDIPPTLLSRFDLIFPMKDVIDEELDKKLAQYILTTHRDAALKKTAEDIGYKGMSPEFLRKYIAYARKNITPVISPEASEKIRDFYTDLRKRGHAQGAVAITPRQIEGLVRLTEASAKARLSQYAEIQDADRAVKLMTYMLQQTAFDRSTGRIDVDIIASGTGQSRSRAEQYYDMIGIIRELAKQFDQISKEMVVEAAKKSGVDEVLTRRYIDEMLRKGELFEPKPGFIKLVQRSE